jgi:hypothetical protein
MLGGLPALGEHRRALPVGDLQLSECHLGTFLDEDKDEVSCNRYVCFVLQCLFMGLSGRGEEEGWRCATQFSIKKVKSGSALRLRPITQCPPNSSLRSASHSPTALPTYAAVFQSSYDQAAAGLAPL